MNGLTSIINQFSFLIIAGLFALFLAVVLFWNEQSPRKQIVSLLLFLAVLGGYFWSRPGASNTLPGEVDFILAAINSETAVLDQPVLVEAYSNY
jgi:drug/metabolite transporter (DMT)-like permease